ncbi:AraC family transcriptional regulator [Aliidongia dinghuensis]|uniref:AraC family transcriptional regulator n=1 Tax=Aliidongia dinghuensis TaxID=1867774 RepID=A0A8J2YV63_9PROT|nr:AraC family transcriptional regulator [Aliidongia dinghuensis]
MDRTVRHSDDGRSATGVGLGRSEAAEQDCIRIGRGGDGIERAEARFRGQAFAPHRHDTYTIGVTLAGVQAFCYRGERQHALPGQYHILHPDELHDGGAGTDEGFAYRVVYLDPRLVQDALGGRPLPFVRTPVLDPLLRPEGFLADALDLQAEIDELARTEIIVAVASLLSAAALAGAPPTGSLALRAIARVRGLIAESPTERHSMATLERVSGLDRWTIARQFRALYGTSPSRFRTLRQLDQVRHLMAGGTPLALAAAEAGFADQSHMTRQFKRAYGLTPAAWLGATGLEATDLNRARGPARRP